MRFFIYLALSYIAYLLIDDTGAFVGMLILQLAFHIMLEGEKE